MDLEGRAWLENVRRMFDVKHYEGYRFYRAGRWYYIENGKFIRPGTGKPDVEVDFVAALTEEDHKEFETVDEDGFNDYKIAYIPESLEGETAPPFILNHGREPEEGLVLIIGYKCGRRYTNVYISRKIEKMERPDSSQ